ncbi:PAS domain-containing protein [Archangium violaceum]|uniref:ATP-binding protein n=1 Tax=Archangium violaceum TaxID=83451 RepID=UPI00193BC425|nr:ATP-binding protein [Archangium violaceum]QRK13256.1 PAS domain-containing protein [Archangium violaceum]
MASTSDPKRETPRRPHTWLLPLLDWFLSEHLRKTPSSELHRHRVLVGACLFAFTASVLYLSLVPFTLAAVPTLLATVCYLGTLLLAHKARSLLLPAMLLCTSAAVGYVVSIFLGNYPEGGFHATSMLIPSFAAYLMGPRLAFLITSFLAVAVGIAHPLFRAHFTTYSSHIPLSELTVLHGAAAVGLMGAWVLSTLHSTSRDSALEALERTLMTLRESEGKLLSLIESTDDLVCSLDTEKRVITANAAIRQLYLQLQGQELVPGQRFVFPRTPELQEHWYTLFDKTLAGERSRFEEEDTQEGVHRVLDISLSPILGTEGKVTGLTLFARDITARKVAETRLGEMHRSLVDVSRYAGMAEIATGVLHNVGNTLNSVNISAGLLNDRLRHSRVSGLRKAASMLREHASDASTFLTRDPRGQQLPDYLLALSEELERERESMRTEVRSLTESVEHIKSIVSMQQQHARAAGVVERLPVPQLIEEALRLHAVSFERKGIHIAREYDPVPPILVDRHNLLQILINLLSNAQHALMESNTPDKRLSIRIRLSTGGDRLIIEVSDNGVGIAPDNLARLFTQGFTTKKTGHGFGLHISALAATEMSGRLTCTSAGPGQGATFTLELPLEGPSEKQEPQRQV